MDRRVDYDAVASAFARRYAVNPYAGVQHALTAFLGGESPRVLEVGCGTGHWLQAAIAGGASLTAGLDPSWGMLERARAAAPQAVIARAGAEGIPFGAAAFDRVFAINAIHHFTSGRAFVEEARRVLTPGGGVLIIGIDPHAAGQRWWVYDYFPGALAADLRRYPPAAAIRARLAEAGFAAIETRVAQEFRSPVRVSVAEARGSLERTSTSQLLVIDDADWEAGLARIRAAGDVVLDIDLRMFATTGWLSV